MAYERKEGGQDAFQISDLPTGKMELPSIEVQCLKHLFYNSVKMLSKQLDTNESRVHETELSWKYRFENH